MYTPENVRPLRTVRENVENLVDYRLRTKGEKSLPDMESVYLSRELAVLAGNVDILLAGPPCEGNSNLNNRTRRIDYRNELYLDAVVAGVALGASVIVVENVPAVKRSKQNVVGRALSLLEFAGYRIDGNGFTLTASDYGTTARAPPPFPDCRKVRADRYDIGFCSAADFRSDRVRRRWPCWQMWTLARRSIDRLSCRTKTRGGYVFSRNVKNTIYRTTSVPIATD